MGILDFRASVRPASTSTRCYGGPDTLSGTALPLDPKWQAPPLRVERRGRFQTTASAVASCTDLSTAGPAHHASFLETSTGLDLASQRRRTDHTGVVAERGRDDPNRLPPCGPEDVRIHGHARRLQQQLPRPGRSASPDHDDLWIEDVHDVREADPEQPSDRRDHVS